MLSDYLHYCFFHHRASSDVQCNYLHQHATTTSTSLKHAIVQFDMPRANKDTIAALTLTHEGATSSNEKAGNGNAKGALKHVRDGGVRITIVRDDAMDLLADLGEMFNDVCAKHLFRSHGNRLTDGLFRTYFFLFPNTGPTGLYMGGTERTTKHVYFRSKEKENWASRIALFVWPSGRRRRVRRRIRGLR